MPEHTNNMNLPPELALVQEALGSLNPAAAGISRERLLFEAGRSAAARSLRLWQGSALGFAGLSLMLAVVAVYINDQQPKIVERERIVEVPVVVPPQQSSAPSSSSAAAAKELVRDEMSVSRQEVRMFQVRRDVLRWGPDMLPPSHSVETPASTDSAREMARWLELPPGTFATPERKMPKSPKESGDD